MDSNKLSADDRFSIADLYYKYSFYIDGRESQNFGSLFTEDAVFELPGAADLLGREAMIALSENAKKGPGGVRHIMSGVVAEAAPFGATGRAYVQAFRYEETAVRLLAMGEYVDELVRAGDGWQFRKRHFNLLSPASLSGLTLAEVASATG
jgi:hypothetical protein